MCSLTVVADEKDVVEGGAVLKIEECERYSYKGRFISCVQGIATKEDLLAVFKV